MNKFEYRAVPSAPVKGVFGKIFKVGDVRISINRPLGDKLLDVTNLYTGGPYQIIDPETGMGRLACETWLEEGLSSGDISECDNDQIPRVVFNETLSQQDAKTLDRYSEPRYLVLRDIGMLGLGKNSPLLSQAISDSWEKHDLKKEFGERFSTRSVRSWMTKHDPATVTMGQLVSLSGRVPRAKRLDNALAPILLEECEKHYDTRGRRNKDTEAAVETKVEILNAERIVEGLSKLDTPSRETIRRMIGKMCTRERYARKYGEQAASCNWDGAGNSLRADQIGELGMIDDTTLDTIVCFDMLTGLPAGRPNICILIDVATRCIVDVFISFEPPTAFTALSTVRGANQLKNIPPDRLAKYPVLRQINCSFSEIVADNGANYVSRAFTQGLADTGTNITLARVKRSRDKNYCERFIHTLNTLLLEKLPGHTPNPKLLRAFGYEPEKDAVLTISELRYLIDFAIYVYHITLHTGIGMPPALKWQRLMEAHGRPMITNLKKFDILTLETVYDVTCSRTGIILDHLRYSDIDLIPELLLAGGAQRAGLVENGLKPEDFVDFAQTTLDNSDSVKRKSIRQRKTKPADLRNEQASLVVKIKRNRADLSAIYVLHPITKEYLRIPAVNEQYTQGLSLRAHQAVRAYAKKANLPFNNEADQYAARHELNEYICSLAPSLDARERKAAARILGEHVPADPPIEEVFAHARHDGMAEVIACEAPASERVDAFHKASRPKRGGKLGAKGSAGMMPNVDDGDEPLPESGPLTVKQTAAMGAVGRAELPDDSKWEDLV